MFKNNNRKSDRIVWKGLSHYRVYANFESISLEEAQLGNISDKGMCIILENHPDISPGDFVNASVVNPYHTIKEIRFEVSGRVIWKSKDMTPSSSKLLVGIEFYSEVDLPDDIVAFCMSVESD
ncbi:MAG: PilZ domain-containing protein [Spirochaetota bacterium]